MHARNKQWLWIAVLGLSTLGQLVRWSTPIGGVAPHEVLMAGTVVWAVLRGWRPLWRLRVAWAWLSFFAWAVVITIGRFGLHEHASEVMVSLAYLGRFGLYLVFGSWLLSKPSLPAAEKIVLAWFVTLAVFGLGQYWFFPDARLLFFIGWDDHLNRAFGTLLDPGFFGVIMALAAVWWQSQEEKVRRWPGIQALFLSLLALSFSRTAYVAYLVGSVSQLLLVRSRQVTLAALGVFLLLVVMIPKDGGGEGQNLTRTRSLEIRQEVTEYHAAGLTFSEALLGRGWYYDLVEQRQITALGQSALATRLRASAVDSSYLHLFFSVGLIGTALFGYASWLTLRPWGSAVIPIAVVIVTHGLLTLTFWYPWVLLALLGIMTTLPRSQR